MEPNYHKRRAKIAARLLARKMPNGFEFDMDTYIKYTECGTAGCIAGLVVRMYGNPRTRYEEIRSEATKLLGISEGEAFQLFIPGALNYTEISEVQAGRVFAHFIKTDEIDWDIRDTPVTISGKKF